MLFDYFLLMEISYFSSNTLWVTADKQQERKTLSESLIQEIDFPWDPI